MIDMVVLVGILALMIGLGVGYAIASRSRDSISIKNQEEIEKFKGDAMQSIHREFDRTVATLNSQMQAATEEMLKRRQEEFVSNSNDKLGGLLRPLQESIKEMKETVSANTAKQSELGGRLDANLNSLFVQTMATQASAEKLANALRGSNQIQGQWGEIVLKELLESQGLEEGKHFDTQVVLVDAGGKSIKNNEGNTMRPDVVLHLDKERDVIIDSKVSLSAYLEYMNANDEDTRGQALDKHVRSIESHVGELIKKNYSGYRVAGKESMGFVIMFVPNSPALSLAMGKNPNLWRKAMENRVYIADDKSLYAALKIIHLTWQQINQASNHEKVYALAQEMLDRVGKFMEAYMEIGNKLKSTEESFEAGLKKLQEGGQSIPVTCRKLKELGAKASRTSKGVPPELLGD